MSLSLKLSDTRVYELQIRARLGTTAHFSTVVVLGGHLELLDLAFERAFMVHLVKGLGVWVQGSGFGVWGSGFKVWGSGLRVYGQGFSD